MSYTEKIDVLDLVIETLKEHEKALDTAVHRLETEIDGLRDPEGDLLRRFHEPI